MLALAELEQLAERFRRDRARRKMTPRAAAVRDNLDRARRALAHAADVVAELDRHGWGEIVRRMQARNGRPSLGELDRRS